MNNATNHDHDRGQYGHDRYGQLVDYNTEVELGDGYTIAFAVQPDGTRSVWLLSPNGHDDQGCAGPESAPHEQPGRPLPQHIKEGLHLTCGRATANGTSCRQPVRTIGAACTYHVGAPRLTDQRSTNR